MKITRPSILFPLFSDVTSIPGIGPKIAANLSKKIGNNIIDLLFHLPHSVIKRLDTLELNNCPSHSIITKKIKINKHLPGYYNTAKPYKILGVCENIDIEIIFFNFRNDYLKSKFPISSEVIVSGIINWYNGKPQITHPDYIVKPENINEIPKFETKYPLSNGLSNKILRKSIHYALEKIPNSLSEWLPSNIVEKNKWFTFKESLKYIHSPKNIYELNLMATCKERLGFDELLANQIGLSLYKKNRTIKRLTLVKKNGRLFKEIIKDLNFDLTNSQNQCLKEINFDLNNNTQMMRMLQGDVGSGKTLVAVSAILNIIESKKQAALMAPTDLLSVQHYQYIKTIFHKTHIKIGLLTGKIKKSEKLKILNDIKIGKLDLVIGTHSLISNDVYFKDLGIAIIDEQHKFGVEQRNKIILKGHNVHLLLMTATPIPRSLTLTMYGDLDISIINEIPKNRLPVITKALPINRYNEIIEAIDRALKKGEKVYWICPLLELSERLDVVALKNRYKTLKAIFNKYNPVLAHGKMLKTERENSINDFLTNKSKILVASTVIEVGIDIPDATIIIIENAERFGLAQLHQLRGRVGRSALQSYCILMYNKDINDLGKFRLETLKNNNDGFYVAEKDLELRGPGEVLGTRQSGEEKFKLSSLRDIKLLYKAKKTADEIVSNKLSNKEKNLNILLSIFNKDEYIKLINKV